jgi:hypothetical protein
MRQGCLVAQPPASPSRCRTANHHGGIAMRGILLWLIGIPIPIIILLWLFGVLG